MIYLICGYRGSGKDTLFKQLTYKSKVPFNWIILRNPSIKLPFQQLLLNHDTQYLTRISFADHLKQCVLQWLNFPPTLDPESFKNMSLKEIEAQSGIEIEKECDKSKSLRDYYRWYGQLKRDEDPEYWCKYAFAHLPKSRGPFIITDWRYQNEYNYITNNINTTNNIVTIRVYRSCVDIPPMIQSEHDLDKFETDYVLIPQINYEEELQHLCNQFPQYHNYLLSL